MPKLTDAAVLSLLSKFDTEWSQFRGMWDQLMPSFQHMSAVVTRCNEISLAMPALESQHSQLVVSIANFKTDLATGKKAIDEELSKYRINMEKELAPLKSELETTRNQIIAIQGARAEAENSFEARKRTQETDLRELEDRVASAQRMLSDIGRLTGAIHAG